MSLRHRLNAPAERVASLHRSLSPALISGLTVLILAAILMMLGAASLRAQDDGRPVMQLSLKQAMQLALQKNYDVRLKALDTESAYANLLGSFAVYDYTLTQSTSFSTTNQRQTSTFSGSESDTQRLGTTFGRQFFTGGEAGISFNWSRRGTDSVQSTLNPQYSNDVTLELSQPILKNFGRDMTERQIIINRNNMKITDATFEDQVSTTLVDVQKKYWDLASSYEALTVATDSLDLARQQLEINKVKVSVGTLPEIEIVQAEQQVAAAEADLLDAQIAIRRAEDALKSALVMEDWNLRIAPTDHLVEPMQQTYDFSEAFNSAVDNRPELRQLRLSLENNEISIAYSRNQLLPSLNLTGSFTLSSAGGTFNPNLFGQEPPEGLPLSIGETFTDMFSGTNRSWTIGANFTYYLDNSAAEASLLNAEVAKKQNMLRMDQLRYSVAVEVRNAIRELEASIKQLEARRKALEYAEKQYEAEKMKFDVGTSTNFQVLDFQNRLAQARNLVIIAQIRYNKALVDYETAIGMTLKNNGVSIETAKEGTIGAAMGN